MLTSTTGFPWKVDELKKSNRKTIHGQELYIEAKVYPVDRTKTVGAELAASLTSPSDYWYQVIIHQRTKTVLEVSHKAQKFQDLTHLVSSFSVPSHISETLKQASVVERVASRFLRQI